VILEGVVTTLSTEGALNIAPMGPIVSPDLDMSKFTLRPFKSSTTYRNLKARGEGVFHVTDNVLLLAQAAIGAPLEPEPATRPAAMVAGGAPPPPPPPLPVFARRPPPPPAAITSFGPSPSTIATSARPSGLRRSPRAGSATSSASIAPGTPCLRPPSWPRGLV